MVYRIKVKPAENTEVDNLYSQMLREFPKLRTEIEQKKFEQFKQRREYNERVKKSYAEFKRFKEVVNKEMPRIGKYYWVKPDKNRFLENHKGLDQVPSVKDFNKFKSFLTMNKDSKDLFKVHEYDDNGGGIVFMDVDKLYSSMKKGEHGYRDEYTEKEYQEKNMRVPTYSVTRGELLWNPTEVRLLKEKGYKSIPVSVS